jgi:ketosteroid isomerase-like protein
MGLRVVVVSLVLPVAMVAQQPPSHAVDTTIRRLEERWRAAQQANDTVAFRELLAPELTVIGTSGSLRDRVGYIASRSTSWIPHSSQFSVDELHLRPYGTTVVVTGRETAAGSGPRVTARFTHVWAQRGRIWTLVAVQRTEIAPP